MDEVLGSTDVPLWKFCCPVCEMPLEKQINQDDIVIWLCDDCQYVWTDEFSQNELGSDFIEWNKELE
jgi:ribosomal protein L37AE/L43A